MAAGPGRRLGLEVARGRVSVTFSHRTQEHYLQRQGQVALHAELLGKLSPGGRASPLQQVQEHRDLIFAVGDATRDIQGQPWEEAAGGGEQPVQTVTEELHELGAGACHSGLQGWIVILKRGLEG